MNTLLETIQTTLLSSNVLSYLDEQVFIVPETDSEVLFPMAYRCPCVILSDGGEDIGWRPAQCEIRDMKVRASVFVYLREPVKALTGDVSVKGVIDITRDVFGILKHNLMGLTGYTQAEPISISKSDIFEVQEDVIIRQILEIKYRRRI